MVFVQNGGQFFKKATHLKTVLPGSFREARHPNADKPCRKLMLLNLYTGAFCFQVESGRCPYPVFRIIFLTNFTHRTFITSRGIFMCSLIFSYEGNALKAVGAEKHMLPEMLVVHQYPRMGWR